MTKPSRAVLIFSKLPETGKVKTRLIPELGAERAAELYCRLLDRQLAWLTAETDYSIQLWLTPSIDHPLIQQWVNTPALSLFLQQGEDLGERMMHAAHSALQSYRQVVLIGVDCPALTPVHLQQAFVWLESHDGVLGPAQDGGYVLLGLKSIPRALFKDHHWGEADVAETTREAMQQLGWRWRELPLLWDLDRAEDLAQLETLGIPLN
ncbi:MAG: TIGR04282 family arsenosugar biosynthesis glycosyltransferase [Candidatus Thiodiazotropha lotti]|uniref:TIGR04282 family arsenosugar biosynthesis glycosyltransferase n=1 Tax=Candidatus Thiodiazotropha lotti TaxID=2792787 RepID=A0A9E4K5S4_9GAMM|nr:TIGR04282 family arsenosugar biosynthesis glycosyltransferase [Candidatus Thiodiazotropha lotti]MCW4204443.1 TIGR04282 family arsenosugar biosynthesis glycosyltransferase [Candidatus Thiodiazotropha lotti]